ncbi:unnamed protein product [Alternaria alternata]
MARRLDHIKANDYHALTYPTLIEDSSFLASVSLVAQQNVRQHNKFAVAVAVSSKKIAVSGSKTYPQVEVKIISSKAIYKIRVAAGSSAIKAISSRAFSQVKVKASIQTQAVHKHLMSLFRLEVPHHFPRQ